VCEVQKYKKIQNETTDEPIKFFLNNELIELKNIGARDTLLDFLRVSKCLTGTKEGCGEGDCGACTVLVGRVFSGKLDYRAVNSCICLMPSLDASHVVTVEKLKFMDGTLHPIQKAIVESHGSQCGFCTPGIVMSLYDFWLKSLEVSDENIEKTLQGNLCRCTGYGPIINAAKSIKNYGLLRDDDLIRNKENMKNSLMNLTAMGHKMGGPDGSFFIVPNSVENFAELFLKHPNSIIVAGATDVGLWITKNLLTITPIIFIGQLKELTDISESTEQIEIGACVTYSQAEIIFSKYFPGSYKYFLRIAGEQIRNVGTIGGNVANGSPIGDLPPLLIALRANLCLRRGSTTRTLDIDKFFIDYGSQDLKKSEFIEKINIPVNSKLFLFPYKISKRRDEDISTLSAVFSFEVSNEKLINVRLAFGGMAAIPKRALNAERVLEGKRFDSATIKLAQLALDQDFNPVTDMRASANYRLQVARNLLKKCYLEFEGGVSLELQRD
jgi:xanthine dehydrogenase small subunit